MGYKVLQFRGQWRQQFNSLATKRMVELQAPRVQKHSFQAGHQVAACQGLVQFKVAVLVITQNRMAFGRQMNTDLMRASGLERDLEQAEPGANAAVSSTGNGSSTQHLDQSDRRHAVRVIARHHLDATLTVRQQVFVQGLVKHLLVRWPGPGDHGQIGLAGLAFAKLIL